MVALAPALLQQLHALDRQRVVDHLEHVVQRQGGQGGAGHRLDLDARAVDRAHRHLDGHGVRAERVAGLDRVHAERMAVGDQQRRLLDRQGGAGAGHLEGIALGQVARLQARQGCRGAAQHRARRGRPQTVGLGADVDHGDPRRALRGWRGVRIPLP